MTDNQQLDEILEDYDSDNMCNCYRDCAHPKNNLLAKQVLLQWRDAEVKRQSKRVEVLNDKELREKLAAIEHERWAEWQKWCQEVIRTCIANGTDPEIALKRWDRQIATPYEKLSVNEKASDMAQVDRYWPLVQAYCERRCREALQYEWQLFRDKSELDEYTQEYIDNRLVTLQAEGKGTEVCFGTLPKRKK